MLQKMFAVLAALSLLLPAASVFAQTLEPPVTDTGIRITEVLANPLGTDSKDSEYIELYNPADTAISLIGYSLSRKNTTSTTVLDDLSIEADGYLVVHITFTLVNTGATLVLDRPATGTSPATAVETIYPALGENESWSLIDDVWKIATPTPGLANPIPEPPVEEEPPEDEPAVLPPVCVATNVVISEIMANPSGVDTDGGEFVELYNAGAETALLENCLLTTDKVSDFELPSISLAPGAYFAVGLADKLLNGGGKIMLVTGAYEETVEYPELGDDEAWALINDTWQTTKLSTAGAANLPTPPEPEVLPVNTVATPVLCAAGKFRNPETNRCKTIVETVSALLPCSAGESRNPLTNRCRKTSTSGSALVPCLPTQERNPTTNRCRNIAGASTSQASCQPGYERNPDTNRCRKKTGTAAGAATFPVSGPAPLHPGILVSVTLLALLYGIYEYRFDFNNWYARFRTKFAK